MIVNPRPRSSIGYEAAGFNSRERKRSGGQASRPASSKSSSLPVPFFLSLDEAAPATARAPGFRWSPKSPKGIRPTRRPRRPFSSKDRTVIGSSQRWPGEGDEGRMAPPRPRTSLDDALARRGPSENSPLTESPETFFSNNDDTNDGRDGLTFSFDEKRASPFVASADRSSSPLPNDEVATNGFVQITTAMNDDERKSNAESREVEGSPLRSARQAALSHLGALPQGSAGSGLLRRRRDGGESGSYEDLARFRRKDVEMEQLVRRLLRDLEELRMEMRSVEEKNQKSEMKRKEERSALSKELEETLQQLRISEQNRRVLVKEKEIVEQQLRDLRTVKDAADHSEASRIHSLEHEVQLLEDRLKARDAEIEAMRPKLLEAANRRKAASDAAGEAVVEVRTRLEGELSSTIRSLKEEREKVSRMEAQLLSLREKLEELEGEKQGRLQEVEILKDSLAKKEESIAEMKSAVEDKGKEMHSLKSEVTLLGKKLQLAEAAKAEAYNVARIEMQDILSKISDDNKKMAETLRENVILKAQVENLERYRQEDAAKTAKASDGSREKLEELEKLLKFEKQRADNYQRTAGETRERLAGAKAECETLKVEMKALRGEIHVLVTEELQRVKGELERERRRAGAEQKKREEAEAESLRLSRRIDEMETLNRHERVASAVAAVREESKEEILALQRESQSVKETNKKLSSALEKVHREKAVLEKRERELRQTLQSDTAAAEKTTREKIEKAECERKEAFAKIDSLRMELSLLRKEKENDSFEVKRLRDERARLLALHESEIETLQSSLSSETEHRTSLQQEIDEMLAKGHRRVALKTHSETQTKVEMAVIVGGIASKCVQKAFSRALSSISTPSLSSTMDRQKQ